MARWSPAGDESQNCGDAEQLGAVHRAAIGLRCELGAGTSEKLARFELNRLKHEL